MQDAQIKKSLQWVILSLNNERNSSALLDKEPAKYARLRQVIANTDWHSQNIFWKCRILKKISRWQKSVQKKNEKSQ